MEIIEKNENCIVYEVDKLDNIFDWFFNTYQGGDIDGKLVTMDEKMLLRILNSRKCFVKNIETTPNEHGADQIIKIKWISENETIVNAEICVHGPNQVFLDLSDDFVNYNIKMDSRDWIYFKDIRFTSEYQGSYECRMLEEFEYGINSKKDNQFIHLVFNRKRDLQDFDLQDNLFKKTKEKNDDIMEI